MKKRIFVDDVRKCPTGYILCKTSDETIYKLMLARHRGIVIDHISFDHDLGGDDTTRPIIIWMIENEYFPRTASCHSSNPVGIEWIEGMIERYFPPNCLVRCC